MKCKDRNGNESKVSVGFLETDGLLILCISFASQHHVYTWQCNTCNHRLGERREYSYSKVEFGGVDHRRYRCKTRALPTSPVSSSLAVVVSSSASACAVDGFLEAGDLARSLRSRRCLRVIARLVVSLLWGGC